MSEYRKQIALGGVIAVIAAASIAVVATYLPALISNNHALKLPPKLTKFTLLDPRVCYPHANNVTGSGCYYFQITLYNSSDIYLVNKTVTQTFSNGTTQTITITTCNGTWDHSLLPDYTPYAPYPLVGYTLTYFPANGSLVGIGMTYPLCNGESPTFNIYPGMKLIDFGSNPLLPQMFNYHKETQTVIQTFSNGTTLTTVTGKPYCDQYAINPTTLQIYNVTQPFCSWFH